MNKSGNFFVTSPIYYVNDAPHIGHAYTSIACDVIARAKRISNHQVFFLTGTDEHGQKVEKSAILKNKKPQEFCDEVSQKFRQLAKNLNLSNDDFIRTTEERHKKSATIFYQILEKKGWIYQGVYEGWYAIRDEAFYSEDELINGKAPTGAEVEWQKQESYFFKLSAFQDKLLALYQAVPDFIKPKSRFNEVVSFVKGGLKDLSISRNTFSWGIAVPKQENQNQEIENLRETQARQSQNQEIHNRRVTKAEQSQNSNSAEPNHVIYVWLDALVNYLSALGFADENSKNLYDFWCDTVDSPLHIVGKDILRFHAVYWPAFLMAAELPLPNRIFAHGWWTNQGEKISKSLGNVIDPNSEIAWIESFGCDNQTAVDYFRYFLMREVKFGNDGDYNRESLINKINSELANNIGNLAQRSLSMIFKNNDRKIVNIRYFEEGQKLLETAYSLKEKVDQKINDLAFDEAIFEIISFASDCNFFINQKAPWNLKKEYRIEEMNLVLSTIAEALRVIAILLQPIIPNLSNKLLDCLNINKNCRNLINVDADFCLSPDKQINEPSIIFKRLEIKSDK